jgi:hypothetical protein
MKKQKRKHHKRHGGSSVHPGAIPPLVQHPFSHLGRDELKAVLLEVADKEIEEFPKLLAALQQLLREKNPLHILSVLAGYGLHAGVSDRGVERRLSSKIEQHHVEMVQALALTLAPGESGYEVAGPGDIQNAIDGVGALTEAFRWRRFKALEDETDERGRAILSLQERVRGHTQAVRNWGAYSQVVRISHELFAPLDGPLREALGFSASDLIAVASSLVDLLQDRSSERLQWLQRVFREHKIPRMVRAYYKYHPTAQGDPVQFLKELPTSASREQVQMILLSHADLLLIDNAQFTAEELTGLTGLSKEVITRVLEALSLSLGSLQEQNVEHLFMENPVWTAPVISLGESYFCTIPQSIFSHINTIAHKMAEAAGMTKQLEERRASYLEAKVAELLVAALPSAVVRNGVKWRMGAIEYETDHVALIDRAVVIVEDKSAALTGPGLRGAPDRVQRHVRDLVADPSEQSTRLEAAIWRVQAGDADAKAALAPFGFDFSEVEQIVRVSVTLDDISIISSAEKELKDAGWIPSDLDLAPTMNVADFEAIIEILGQSSFFLHYLSERQRIQKDGHVLADELDFLGIYLETGLNLGNLEEQNVFVQLTGSSAPIDHYYNSLDAGVAVAKPRPKLSPYMASLVGAIETKAFPRWTTVTVDLLRCATYEEQRRLEKLLKTLKSKVESNWRDPDHECSLMVGSHALRNTIVVFFVYPPALAARRRELAENLASKVFEDSRHNRCIMITRDTARWTEPYASVFILYRAGEAHKPPE